MTIAELITFTRKISNRTNTSTISDADLLIFLNIAYHDIANTIRDKVNEDYFWDTFTASTVAEQSEYTLQDSTATQVWVDKVLRVEVKRDNEDDYRSVVNKRDLSWYDRSSDWLADHTPVSSAFYDYKEGSIFLYPSPSEWVSNWLVIHATKTLIDLALLWAETTIFPNHSELRSYHRIIGIWALYFLELDRNIKDKNDVNFSKTLYEIELDKMVDNLNAKTTKPMEQEDIDLSIYA